MKVRKDFWKFIRFKLESGSEIKFWEDIWVGGEFSEGGI